VAGGRAQDDRVQRREARGAHGALRRQPAIPYTSAEDANEVWDLDNLIKPTLDAMEGVFGLRPWGVCRNRPTTVWTT
jgi:hypothetical protein